MYIFISAVSFYLSSVLPTDLSRYQTYSMFTVDLPFNGIICFVHIHEPFPTPGLLSKLWLPGSPHRGDPILWASEPRHSNSGSGRSWHRCCHCREARLLPDTPSPRVQGEDWTDSHNTSASSTATAGRFGLGLVTQPHMFFVFSFFFGGRIIILKWSKSLKTFWGRNMNFFKGQT